MSIATGPAVAAAIVGLTDAAIRLIILYNSLPDAEEEAKARFNALLPVLQGENAWLQAYEPKRPH